MASQELIGCLKSDGAILGYNWHWPEQKFRYMLNTSTMNRGILSSMTACKSGICKV